MFEREDFTMSECYYCKKKISMPFKCKFCGKYFCAEHRLPENHECSGLIEHKQRAKKEVNVIYEPFRHYAHEASKKQKFSLQNYLPKKITNFLVGVTILISLIGLSNISFFNLFALDPAKILAQPWRLVTSMFLHAGLWHLFLNMFVLFMFGRYLEKKIGKLRFLILYFVAGIIASVGYSIFALYTLPAIAVGASGAIYGILGALVFLAPEIRVFIMFIPIPVKLSRALIIFIVLDLVLRLAGAPIANTAHLAGLLVGLLYGYFLRKKLAIRGLL